MKDRLEKKAIGTYKTILALISIVCMLFWWIPLLFGIGSVFRGNFMQALISFLVTVLLLIFWKGGESLDG